MLAGFDDVGQGMGTQGRRSGLGAPGRRIRVCSWHLVSNREVMECGVRREMGFWDLGISEELSRCGGGKMPSYFLLPEP